MLNVDLVKLVGVIAIISIMAGIAFFSGAIETKSTNKALNHSFDSSLSNDKFIFVQGWNEAELKKILNDFKKIYESDNYPAYSINIKSESINKYKLIFPDDIHPSLFIFLVNYLCYPFDLDFNNREITAAGETTLNKDFQGISPILMGQKAIFYTPKDNKDKDVVYLYSKNNTTLKMSFTNMEWENAFEPRFNELVKKLKNSF